MAKPRIIITGGSGLLAVNWCATMRDRFDVVLAFHERMPALAGSVGHVLDLSSRVQIQAALDEFEPQAVIHAAGCTSVEGCEKAPELARHVNVELAENVAWACASRATPLVHISTDHLFAGDRPMATEETPVAPQNVYGATKAEAEVRVAKVCPEALIIRTNFYGWGTSYRQSFSDAIIGAVRQGRRISLFDDVYYTPILAESLIETSHALLERGASGVFNVVGSERLTKLQFGLMLAEVFALDASPIHRGAIADVPNLVARPRDMSLSNEKVRSVIGQDVGSVKDQLARLRQQALSGLASELEIL
ncbi:SDR family oxidoreductase [Nitrogeniibacter mangrovi]|uniref:SDR family oxidoreductase n=1 Tax=Nitrogeniibacter mangrovi TaxID=2016596 RepID=A0A6C1B071_9RHOO|nr:SDR family oxidoreductase [Nitrogeniibacter mangrovi]QID16967.1 SDR family oxidoreductase [Nitrogeniibacter mangrovi]